MVLATFLGSIDGKGTVDAYRCKYFCMLAAFSLQNDGPRLALIPNCSFLLRPACSFMQLHY